MPDLLHPPFNPNSVIRPKLCDRWLDINSQNGPLGRTQTYITLPAFNQPVTWLGYSDIVCSFNFEGPNNFSLKYIQGNIFEGLLSALPVGPNYLLCISWIDATTTPYTVNRYSLWQGVGEVMYVPYPLYNNEKIGQNFRLEVWSVSGKSTVSQATPINLYTSKLGQMDYRYGTDLPLVGADFITTNFSIGTTAFNDDYPADLNLLFVCDPTSIVNISLTNYIATWNDKNNIALQFSPGSNPPNTIYSTTSNTPSNVNCVKLATNAQSLTMTTPSWYVQSLVICCKILSNEASSTSLFSAYSTGIEIIWNSGTITCGGSGPSVSGLSQGIWYTIILSINGNQMALYVYNTQTLALIGSQTIAYSTISYTTEMMLGNCAMQILECAAASSSISLSDAKSINQYINGKYFGLGTEFTFPFTWPAGAVSNINLNINNWLSQAITAP